MSIEFYISAAKQPSILDDLRLLTLDNLQYRSHWWFGIQIRTIDQCSAKTSVIFSSLHKLWTSPSAGLRCRWKHITNNWRQFSIKYEKSFHTFCYLIMYNHLSVCNRKIVVTIKNVSVVSDKLTKHIIYEWNTVYLRRTQQHTK